jgi:hypothetical protein
LHLAVGLIKSCIDDGFDI